MADRQLTRKQENALLMLPATYRWTLGSMPSLAKRGLVVRYYDKTRGTGRGWATWRITEAGQREQARIREARAQEVRQRDVDRMLSRLGDLETVILDGHASDADVAEYGQLTAEREAIWRADPANAELVAALDANDGEACIRIVQEQAYGRRPT